MKRSISLLSIIIVAVTLTFAQTMVTPVFPHKDGEASATGFSGSEKDIMVNGSGGTEQVVGWVIFQTADVDFTTIASGMLTLYVEYLDAPGTLNIHGLTAPITNPENNVLLSDLQYNPVPWDPIHLGTSDIEKIVQLDITPLLKAGNFYGIALASEDGLIATFDAKEGDLKPLIMLTHDIKSAAGKWYTGSNSPDDTMGKDGDLYLDIDIGDVYDKSSGVWTLTMNINGPQGLVGTKGDKGDTGIQGLKGDKGDAGTQGLKGDKGDIGAQGSNGDKGDVGSPGIKGENGDAGPQGPKGDPGQDGSPDTPEQVLAKLVKVDGSKSTLDADLVDGMQASEIISAASDEVRSPISSVPLTITSSGSYYFTGNMTMTTSETGIVINANNVTIDLMGFTLSGNGGTGAYDGIHMPAGTKDIEIRNGTVRNFSQCGIYSFSTFSDTTCAVHAVNLCAEKNGNCGINLNGFAHLIKDCRVFENGAAGVYSGSGGTVTGNVVFNNQGNGIFAAKCGTVTGNTVYKNLLDGISIIGGTVSGNTSYNNQGTGINSGPGNISIVTGNTVYGNRNYGIYSGNACTVTGNIACDNQLMGIYIGYSSTVTGNTANYNQGTGIRAGGGSTVTGNTVNYNNQSEISYGSGISVVRNCIIINNNCTGNKQHNIYVFNDDNIIEKNLVTDSNNGIFFNATTGKGNFYANNRASGNTTNYTNTTGNTNGGGNVSF